MKLEIFRGRNEVTPQEREYGFERIFNERPLSNIHIWIVVIEAASTRRGRRFLSEEERDEMVDVINSTHHLGFISAGEIMRVAGIKDLSDAQFLGSVCFNYGYEIVRAPELREKAYQELQSGKRESFSHFDYLDIKDRVRGEFDGSNNPYVESSWIEKNQVFNRSHQRPEFIFRISESRGLGLWSDDYVREIYRTQVIPFIAPDELILAGVPLHFDERPSELTRVVRRYL